MSAWYNNALDGFPSGTINWPSSSIKATLVGTGYTFNAADGGLSALGGNVLSGTTDQTLAGNAVNDPGIAVSNSLTFSGVSASQTLQAIVIYQDLGGGTTLLLAYIDTGSGLPFTTVGTDITVDWNGTPGSGTVFTVT